MSSIKIYKADRGNFVVEVCDGEQMLIERADKGHREIYCLYYAAKAAACWKSEQACDGGE